MSNNPALLKKLLDDDELEQVELQKGESPVIVKWIGPDTAGTSYKKKSSGRRGWACCCCKFIGVTMMLFALLGIFVVGYVYACLTKAVEDFTVETDSPKKFPIVQMSDDELEQIADRVENFIDHIFEQEKVEDLVITQDEINAFIGHSDFLRGNLMVTLHKDRMMEEFSIPMDILGFDNRYFVGNDYVALKKDGQKDIVEVQMETEATHEDWFDGPLYFLQLQYLITKNKEDEGFNMLELYLEKGSFFGQVAPQEIIDQHENLLKELYDEDDEDLEDMLDVISGIESVFIEEGKVVIKARRFDDMFDDGFDDEFMFEYDNKFDDEYDDYY
jgi:predicted house-cleaning noncanonical NTP pyrophosphatase (MazG superfamily)